MASIILTMLEKPTQKRFNSWEHIEEKFQSEESGILEEMSEIVDFAISKKISKDTEEQQRIEKEERTKREKDNFCKIVKMQFESTVIDCLRQFVEQYNEHSSSKDKCILKDNSYHSNESFHYFLNIPSVAKITIKCKVILPNSATREVDIRRGIEYHYCEMSNIKFTPQYKNKDIM